MKKCTKCKQEQPLSNFYASKGKIRPECKECAAQLQKSKYDKNLLKNGLCRRNSKPPKLLNDREVKLWYKYHLTAAEHKQMLIKQNYCCAICGIKAELVVDHNHLSNKVRELLCILCNLAIGMLKDNHINAQNAANYLIKHSS